MDNIYKKGGLCPCKTFYCTQCKYNQRRNVEIWYKREIVNFFKRNPYPNYHQLLKLAQELGISYAKLNQFIYHIMTDMIHKEI